MPYKSYSSMNKRSGGFEDVRFHVEKNMGSILVRTATPRDLGQGGVGAAAQDALRHQQRVRVGAGRYGEVPQGLHAGNIGYACGIPKFPKQLQAPSDCRCNREQPKPLLLH